MFFSSCVIYILPSGVGKKRITLLKEQVLKNGGKIESCYTPIVTHVVVDKCIAENISNITRILADQKIEVNPDSVCVTTDWISKCLKEKKLVSIGDFEISELKEKCNIPEDQKLKPECQDDSYSCPLKKQKVDNFQQADLCTQTSKDESAVNVNQNIISELQKLADAFQSNGDTWRAHGYNKAISALRAHGKKLTRYEEAIAIPGIGKKMAEKIQEILESGSLRKVQEICDSEKTKVLDLFTKIWGVGPSTAEGWYLQGYRNLQDLQQKANLTKQQIIGIKYFEDIQDRIPRAEVEEILCIVKNAALNVKQDLSVELCGSYRRGKSTCGDVDILITIKDEDNAYNILNGILSILKSSGFVTDDLVSMEANRKQRKYLGMCRLPGKNSKNRRLDIFVVPESEHASALMHYTGSALFNRSIRILAAKYGMSLTEHGLFAGITRDGKTITNEGYLVPTPTEESIFKELNLEYAPPEKRDH